MSRITQDTIADIFFQINWTSTDVQHTDAYAGRHVNFWRDHLPPQLHNALSSKQSGDHVRLDLPAKELIDAAHSQALYTIPSTKFDPSRMGATAKYPRVGRFYPKGLLKDMPGIFQTNVEPFRCIQIENGNLDIDMGHPLFSHLLGLNLTVGAVQSKSEERGGSMHDWSAIITDGVGMQSRWHNQPTDFFDHLPYAREDESPDIQFYEKPRLVQHIDDAAMDILEQLFARFLNKGMNVLDLMSSWQSHIPAGIPLGQLSGIGLNEIELQHNPDLTDYHIQDLNKAPRLPYSNASYDLVLCSLSVEYLIHPREIFTEVSRVLRPEGWFIVTFSNRQFAPKSIRIWTELHEFERMGLVLEYFRRDRLFNQLHTYSVRGIERPAYDKYFGQLPFADPVYAVWGRRM